MNQRCREADVPGVGLGASKNDKLPAPSTLAAIVLCFKFKFILAIATCVLCVIFTSISLLGGYGIRHNPPKHIISHTLRRTNEQLAVCEKINIKKI
ncbi:MAG: hypothetical protein IT258_08275 [Saprospiraceae bacterium]|nr:hypothetical protein [Saprospiraceae bacterium]